MASEKDGKGPWLEDYAKDVGTGTATGRGPIGRAVKKFLGMDAPTAKDDLKAKRKKKPVYLKGKDNPIKAQ